MAKARQVNVYEEILYETQIWPVWLAKLIGYLALCPSNSSKTLCETRWYQACGLNCLLHGMIVLGLCVYLILFNFSSEWYIKAKGTTEMLVFTVLSPAPCIVGTYYKFKANSCASDVLSFWKKTSNLLEVMSSHGVSLDKHASAFRACQASNRRDSTFYMGGIIAFVCVVNIGYPLLAYLLGSKLFGSYQYISVRVSICNVLWAFCLYSNLCYTTWVLSFLQVYKCCIEIVIAELHGLSIPKELAATAVGVRRINVVAIDVNRDAKPVQEMHMSLSSSVLESKILNCIKIYYEIESHINQFTLFWGTRLLVEVFLHASCILVYLFLTILWLKDTNDTTKLLLSIPPLVLYLMSFDRLGGSCTMLVEGSQRVLATLEGLTIREEFSPTLTQKVQMLITKIMIRPPEVAPGMYCVLNRRLVTSIGAGIATFLVVLVQFRTADNF